MGRSLALTLSLGAAVLVLLGTLTTAWWSYQSQDWEASMGLSEARFCSADTCRSGPVGGRGNDAQWVRAGSASYAGGFVAGGLLLAMLATGLMRRWHDLLIKTNMVACASTLISAVVFVWLIPEYPDMSPGYSMYAYFVGCALGMGASVANLRMVSSAQGPGSSGAEPDN